MGSFFMSEIEDLYITRGNAKHTKFKKSAVNNIYSGKVGNVTLKKEVNSCYHNI
jgi:hypothetical protein